MVAKSNSTSIAVEPLHAATAHLLASGMNATWWTDGRERHCAYCGVTMRQRGVKQVPTKATADHVIPSCHGGPALTVPACHACNSAKGAKGLPEFLASGYFKTVRTTRKNGNAWPEHELWAVHAIAALRKTHDLMLAAAVKRG
jgi:hypothetical protein